MPNTPKPINLVDLGLTDPLANSHDLETGQPTSTGSQYFLTDEELYTLTERANHGDVFSATKIEKYYKFSNPDAEKNLLWLKKSSALGDLASQFNLAIFYKNSQELGKARTWAGKAASSCDARAQALLDEINRLAREMEQRD